MGAAVVLAEVAEVALELLPFVVEATDVVLAAAATAVELDDVADAEALEEATEEATEEEAEAELEPELGTETAGTATKDRQATTEVKRDR